MQNHMKRSRFSQDHKISSIIGIDNSKIRTWLWVSSRVQRFSYSSPASLVWYTSPLFCIPHQVQHFYTCFSRLHEKSEENQWGRSAE